MPALGLAKTEVGGGSLGSALGVRVQPNVYIEPLSQKEKERTSTQNNF